tara:strand:+ start:1724 stop:1990 length:267 start_codon:yes stop_codon:yes gene_type:complete
MAELSESVVQDKIEIVDAGTYKVLQVRTATIIAKDDVEISRSFHRHVVSPNSDVSGETDEVKALADIYFTDAAKAAQTAAEAANALGE